MKLTAVVLHNCGPGMFWKYDPKTAELYHAHNFDIEADSIEQGANLVWDLANVGDADELRLNFAALSSYAPQVVAYRDRMNRSLSVGDVIIFSEGERPAGALVVASLGFERLATDPDFNGVASNTDENSAAFGAHVALLRDQRTPGGRALSL